MTATITVWLPDPGWVEVMGGLPEPMTADVWTGGEELPDSVGEVEIVVIPFGVAGSRLAVLGKLPKLRLVQLMSAGAERVIPHVPAGVTLCNARGAHDPAVAEWIMAVILAQLRSLPGFVEAQRAGTWAPSRSSVCWSRSGCGSNASPGTRVPACPAPVTCRPCCRGRTS
jgi:lactate dehydrogenase-like 2-hydroxyacid dehydrogenase